MKLWFELHLLLLSELSCYGKLINSFWPIRIENSTASRYKGTYQDCSWMKLVYRVKCDTNGFFFNNITNDTKGQTVINLPHPHAPAARQNSSHSTLLGWGIGYWDLHKPLLFESCKKSGKVWTCRLKMSANTTLAQAAALAMWYPSCGSATAESATL